jgi:hypothetical protein
VTARYPIIVTALLVLAPLAYAAHLGPARRVGPVGNGAATALLGTVLPFGDGHVAFTSQPMTGSPSLYEIVATPIDRDGVVQYDKARTLVTGVSSAPLAAATSSGYLLCWTASKEVFTVALSPSLELRSSFANDLGSNLGKRGLACNGDRCLLIIAGTESGNSPYLVTPATVDRLDERGAAQSNVLLLQPHVYATSLIASSGGFTFVHGGATGAITETAGVTWLDADGNVTAETAVGQAVYDPALIAHPSGVLMVAPLGTVVRTWIVSPERGVLKKADLAPSLEVAEAAVASNGTNFLLAVSGTNSGLHGPWQDPYGISAELLNGNLEIVRPWFKIAEVSDETGPAVSYSGGSYLVSWKRSGIIARSASVTSTGVTLVVGGRALALAPTWQWPIAFEAEADSELIVWSNVAGEPPATILTRVDRVTNSTSTLLGGSLSWNQAVWNGSDYSFFGGLGTFNGSAEAKLIGGKLDTTGQVQQTELGRGMSLSDVWWDGSSFVVLAFSGNSTTPITHILHVTPDMTVLSDVTLPYLTRAAAGIPGRTLTASLANGRVVVTILNDAGERVATTALAAPQPDDGLYFRVISNGRDQFLLLVQQYGNGTVYVTRFTQDGKQLDDFSPVMRTSSFPFVQPFGDRWLLAASGIGVEFPVWKAVDLSAAGAVVAMARASFERIVLLCSETVTVDDKPLQLLMVRDLIDDSPPRRHASH